MVSRATRWNVTVLLSHLDDGPVFRIGKVPLTSQVSCMSKSLLDEAVQFLHLSHAVHRPFAAVRFVGVLDLLSQNGHVLRIRGQVEK